MPQIQSTDIAKPLDINLNHFFRSIFADIQGCPVLRPTTMNSSAAVLTFLVALLLPQTCESLLYDWLTCPYIDVALESFLGTSNACDCYNRPTFFTRYGPGSLFIFAFGIDAECSYNSTEGLVTKFDQYQRGRYGETELCMDLDWPEKENPTACLKVEYNLKPADLFKPNYTPKECTISVNGTACNSCVPIGGRPPLPYVEYDCGDLLPPKEVWDGFNKDQIDWQDEARNGHLNIGEDTSWLGRRNKWPEP